MCCFNKLIFVSSFIQEKKTKLRTKVSSVLNNISRKKMYMSRTGGEERNIYSVVLKYNTLSNGDYDLT